MKIYENINLYMQSASKYIFKGLQTIYGSKLAENEKKILISEFTWGFQYLMNSLKYFNEKYPYLENEKFAYDKEKITKDKEFQNLVLEANKLLVSGDFKEAKAKFEELAKNDKFEIYKTILENSLYECEHGINKNLDKIHKKFNQNYETIDEIYQKALNFEKEKKFEEARENYKNLAKISEFPQYEDLAIAGIYRCEKALNLY